MLSKQSNKRPVESFIVSKAGEAILSDGATTLTAAASPYEVQLNDGQIGIFSASDEGTVARNVATDATPTITEAPILTFIQGTPGSADLQTNPYGTPLWNRPYETTAPIDGRTSVKATFQAYSQPTFSTNFIGGPNAQTIALDNTEFTARIAFRGRIMDEFYSPEGANQLTVSKVTPDFSTLGTAQPVDWIYQNFVWNINRNSSAVTIDKVSRRGNYPIVALAIDTTGATGGTVINALAPGFIPLVNTTAGVRGMTMTQDQIDSINDAVTAAGYNPATATLLVADLATAGQAAGGVADAILTLALDRTLAYSDQIPQVKTSITTGLTNGFDYLTVGNQITTMAYEGEGLGRQMDLLYKSTQGQRKYNAEHEMDPVVEFPSPVNTNQTYATFILQHEDANQIDVGNVSASPQKSIILIPSADAGPIANLTTALNSWLASGGNPTI